jgi:ABC-2 type transport system permease protein
MTSAPTTAPKPPDVPTPPSAPQVPLDKRLNLSALGTLFVVTLWGLGRGKRLLVLIVLYSLPLLLVWVVKTYAPEMQDTERHPNELRHMEFAVIFNMLPTLFVPLTALLFASGMIQDEIEEQTLTYLLVRPLPRWAVYLMKLLACVLVAAVLAAVFSSLALSVIWMGREPPGGNFVARVGSVIAAQSLGLLTYCAVFGFLSLFVKRILVVGVGYILLFEGVLANIPLVVREFTVMFQYRVLIARWLDLGWREWRIEQAAAPTAETAMQNLLVAALVATAAAAYLFTTREFRLKTPEGN